jgi:DNA-binding MarR family transcriptional regulator
VTGGAPFPYAPFVPERAGPSRDDLALRLHWVAIHLLRRVRRRDVESGLTGPQLSALSVFGFGGRRTLSELAQAEQVSRPTITRLIASLEARGLVVREPDDKDRRVTWVRATERGREMMERGRAARVEQVAAMLARLEPVELATLDTSVAALERLMSELSFVDPGAAEPEA